MGRPPAEWQDHEKTNHYAPYPTWPCRLTYGGMVLMPWNIRRWQCWAPSLKGPPAATGKVNQEDKRKQQAKSLSSHLETSAVPLVYTQWNAEGLRKKKPELQEFLKRDGVDIICIQETHLKDAHHLTLRGYGIFRHDRADRHKGGTVTLVRNTILAVEVRGTEGDSEYPAIRVVVQSREITVINYYCPTDKELQVHTLPLVNHHLLITSDFNGDSPSWGYADLNSRGEQIEDWMIENSLILINRPDDQPTHLSCVWKTFSTPELVITSEDIQKICDREVYTQLGGSDHLPDLLKVTLTEQTTSQKKEPSWNYKKADSSKFQNLTDVLCRKLDTDNSKNINTSVQQPLIAYFRQQSRPSSEARGRTTSLTGVTTYREPPTESPWPIHRTSEARKRLEQLPSPEHTILYNKARTAVDKEKNKEAHKSWQKKDWLIHQHGERHTEALESDKGPEWRSAACPKSSPCEGRYPDLHRQEGSLLACRQFPRGQPTWYLKGETSRHQNDDQRTTTETISHPKHDIWVLHPWAELCYQTAKKQESPREGWHFQWDDLPSWKCG